MSSSASAPLASSGGDIEPIEKAKRPKLSLRSTGNSSPRGPIASPRSASRPASWVAAEKALALGLSELSAIAR